MKTETITPSIVALATVALVAVFVAALHLF